MGIDDFFLPGHSGKVKAMLFFMGTVQQPDNYFVSRIGFQNRGGRVAVNQGTKDIGRVILVRTDN